MVKQVTLCISWSMHFLLHQAKQSSLDVSLAVILKYTFVFCLPETALKLDSLVGDVEEAVSSTLKRKHSFARSSEVRTNLDIDI